MSLRQNYHHFPRRASVLVTAPAIEVVELADLKTHLRIEAVEEDAYLTTLIIEARRQLEDRTGLALINQTHRMTIDRWPGRREQWWDGMRQGAVTELHGGPPGSIELPRYPLSSITSITTYDEDSNSSTVTVASTFDVDTDSMPGRITLQSGATWPVAQRQTNAVEIVYVAGYGSAVSDVPQPLVEAVRRLAGFKYDHRGDGCTPEEEWQKSGAEGLANMYRVARL